ncbi:hypothetical protein PCL_04309 [Purpureocillium lilacinum]|uniref:Uncharacterized protein n=1 Tax=Purpureocillium lilacinum TaxID=33203 RepID=A0A2U3DY33_PURLI|nr:hypothetical protein PCL_04309 [Purpureocillium lilacinum]
MASQGARQCQRGDKGGNAKSTTEPQRQSKVESQKERSGGQIRDGIGRRKKRKRRDGTVGGRLVARAGGKLEEEVVVVVVEDGMVLDATTRPHLTSPRLTEPSRVQYVGTKQHCTVRRRHPFHPLRTGICQHLQQARARQFGPASGWAEPPRWADGDPGMGSLGQALWGPGGEVLLVARQWTSGPLSLELGRAPASRFTFHGWMLGGRRRPSLLEEGGKGLVSSGPSISSGRASYGWAGCCHRALSSRSLEDPLDAGGFYAMDGPPSPALSAPSASPLILVHEWNQAPRRARTELAAGIERAGKSSSHHQARSNPPEVPPCTTTCTTCTTSWLGCCHRSATMGHAASPNPCARPPASDSRLMRRHCRGSSSWDSSTQSRPAPIAAQGHRHPSPRPQQAATAGPARLEPMAHEGGPWDPGRHSARRHACLAVLARQKPTGTGIDMSPGPSSPVSLTVCSALHRQDPCRGAGPSRGCLFNPLPASSLALTLALGARGKLQAVPGPRFLAATNAGQASLTADRAVAPHQNWKPANKFQRSGVQGPKRRQRSANESVRAHPHPPVVGSSVPWHSQKGVPRSWARPSTPLTG